MIRIPPFFHLPACSFLVALLLCGTNPALPGHAAVRLSFALPASRLGKAETASPASLSARCSAPFTSFTDGEEASAARPARSITACEDADTLSHAPGAQQWTLKEDSLVNYSSAELLGKPFDDGMPAPPQLFAPVGSLTWMTPSYSLPMPAMIQYGETNLSDTRAVNQSIRQTWQPPKPYLLRWDQGRLTGFNAIQLYPMLGTDATAGLSVTHRFDDKWTLSGTAAVSHFVIPYLTENTAITSAQLTYQANAGVSFSVFGTYRTPSFMSSMANPAAWQYGGYMTLQTDNHLWGVDMGARREYNPYTGRVESVPILMPYYNLQGQKLGFDFGGVLKSIFINQQMKRNLHPAGGAAPAPGPPQGTKPAWLR